jgi:EmrB/QacA subfamily drug resistance transporter
VNAYTIPFALLLLPGVALADRYGRRRLFVLGLTVFTAGSAAAALSTSSEALIAARAIQGAGGGIVTPLTLTLLSAAVSPEHRGLALGSWGAISGLAIALGPLAGGAVVEGWSWQWIFWLNVPLGVAAVALAGARIDESTGPSRPMDLPGLGLASMGLLGIVWALVQGNELGWESPGVASPLVLGLLFTAAFVLWELKTPAPMIPMRYFGSRGFAAANVTSLLLFFGIFGSIFLLAQFLQLVKGYSALEAGIRTLPWTAMLLVIGPLAGFLSDHIGSRRLVVAGTALTAVALGWLAAISSPTVSYWELAIPFLMAGVGMSLFLAPTANAALSAVDREDEGIASGVLNTIRQVGAALGVAVLAAVFALSGSYASPGAFVSGLSSAMWVAAAVVGIGVLAAWFIPTSHTPSASRLLLGKSGTPTHSSSSRSSRR